MGQRVSSWFRAEPYHVYDVYKYSDTFCSIVGVNCYQYVGNPVNGLARISPVRVVHFVVLHLLLMVVAVIHATIPYELVNNGSLIVMYGIRTLLTAGMFAVSGIIMFSALKWKSITQLLQKVHQLDLKVKQWFTHKKHILTSGCLSLLLYQTLLTTYNVGTVLYIEDTFVSWRMVFGQLYFNAIYFTVVFRFYTLACIISFRVVHLNNALRLRFDTYNGEWSGRWLDSTKYRAGTVQERIRIVQKMADMHHQLNEITDHMNGVFGDVFIGNMMVVMLFCAFNVFTLLKLYGSADAPTRMFAWCNFGGSSFYTMMFMLFVHYARTVLKEVKCVFLFVFRHGAMNNETNDELIRSMMVFSRQIRNRSAFIGSRGVNVDWPLIFQVRFG
uniref:Gustatory receptor n=1 Tax=Anopheles funestus TaxID=62324 RepID=A0A182S4Y5_ANOFN